MEIAKVPVSNDCHCGLDPQAMAVDAWMPDQVRHDRGISAISSALTPGWMEEKRKTSPERVFAQEVLAQFLQEGAGVFRRVTEAIDHTLGTDPFKVDAIHQHSYVFGVDWGRHNDYTVIIVIDVTELQWFLLELDRLGETEFTRARVMAIVRSFAGRRVYFSKAALVKPESVKVARALIDVGCTVAATRDRLVDGGYCVSINAAYRIVRVAVEQRGKDLAASLKRSQEDLFRMPI